MRAILQLPWTTMSVVAICIGRLGSRAHPLPIYLGVHGPLTNDGPYPPRAALNIALSCVHGRARLRKLVPGVDHLAIGWEWNG